MKILYVLRLLSTTVLLFNFFVFIPAKLVSSFPRAEVKLHNGVPTVFINGIPNAGMTYMTYNAQYKNYQSFGNAGVDLASLSTTSDYSLYFDQQAWIAPDTYDYTDADTKMRQIRAANPNAYIFPRIYMCSPPWWDLKYPDELAQYDDGATYHSIEPALRKKAFPSFASKQWRADAGTALRKFIGNVRTRPYGEQVIGYHIASGGTEEWYYLNTGGYYLDYSKPQQEAFREWLQKKYLTESALQASWNDGSVTFKNARIPTPAELDRPDLIMFFDPRLSRRIIDYNIFHSEIVAETIAYFAHIVKEATNNEQLCGVFYGYTFEMGGAAYTGHLALNKLLNNPDIDFFTAPTSYYQREIGGHSSFMAPVTSVALHGKVWFDENDYRTYLTPPDAGYGRTDNIKDSEAAQIRQLGNELSYATPAWWFDMGGGWYDSPDFMQIIKKLNSIAERSIDCDRQSSAEIAIVVDEESMCYLKTSQLIGHPTLYEQRLEIGKIGAPVDYILLNDLSLAKNYKMYVFMNAFHVNSAQRIAIQSLLGGDTKTIVWIYAPGFSGENPTGIDGIASLTGLRIAMEPTNLKLEVGVSYAMANTHLGMEQEFTYGTERTIGPVFYGDDPNTTVLGTITGTQKPGLITKKVNNVQVYYSSAPLLKAELLRAIASKSGVHIYNTKNDALYANKSFLAIHTLGGGTRTIRLPKTSDLFEVYEEKPIASQVSEVTINLPARHTALYYMGSAESWMNRSSVEQEQLPTSYALFQNYPNPFNASTSISYSIQKRTHVSLQIYDILGQEVVTLVNVERLPGAYTVTWNGTTSTGNPAASGVYFFRLKAGNFEAIKKMALIK